MAISPAEKAQRCRDKKGMEGLTEFRFWADKSEMEALFNLKERLLKKRKREIKTG